MPGDRHDAAEARARWEGVSLPRLPEADGHEQARARIREMSPTEQRRTLVATGIYTEDGQLTPRYRAR
jgi:hypothetical protein